MAYIGWMNNQSLTMVERPADWRKFGDEIDNLMIKKKFDGKFVLNHFSIRA